MCIAIKATTNRSRRASAKTSKANRHKVSQTMNYVQRWQMNAYKKSFSRPLCGEVKRYNSCEHKRTNTHTHTYRTKQSFIHSVPRRDPQFVWLSGELLAMAQTQSIDCINNAIAQGQQQQQQKINASKTMITAAVA